MEMLHTPYGYDALCRDLQRLSAMPGWRLACAGSSRQGRAIWVLRRGRYGPLIHASHHANEWITSAVLMRWLLQTDCTAPVTVVPMVNPDGVELVTGMPSPKFVHWAQQHTGDVPFPTGWKANAAGVDLNLNYPAGWEQAVTLKRELGVTSPAARDWPGPCPLSEPESQALARVCTPDIPRVLALHSQGGEIYWNYADCAPPDALLMAQKMAMASGYIVAEPPATASHAGHKDWFLLHYRKPAYTVEIGYGENPLPLSDFSALCQQVFPLLDAFCTA